MHKRLLKIWGKYFYDQMCITHDKKSPLTHLMPLISFDTPWKHQKTFVFRGYQKRWVAWNGLKKPVTWNELKWIVLVCVNKGKSKEILLWSVITHNPGQNMLKLHNDLVQTWFATSKTKLDI